MSEPIRASARVNGITLTYRRWTRPDAPTRPPVVLLHGVLQTGAGMRHLAERLAQTHEVVAPDLRGRGDSERPPDGYDPATMAQDVAALLRDLGLESSVVIGRLHGGVVAYHLAARHSEAVCGLVLGDVNPEVSEERAQRVLDTISQLPSGFGSLADAERFYAEILRLPPERASHDIPSDLEPTGDGGYRWRHDLEIVRRVEAAAMPRADWEVLAQVRCPVLLLFGQRGQVRPETAQRMREIMPQARAHTIYGAAHDVFLGPGAEQTMAAIQLFLTGLGAET
jgi:pimeloyl-ACP methyl ester carboxylesterase